mmetsp:Transcript_371/g.628  ORF Transcript_371/g.628 Transcript_371/m.628 type:complete len:202 (+) Transcript_371:941-1546(+)
MVPLEEENKQSITIYDQLLPQPKGNLPLLPPPKQLAKLRHEFLLFLALLHVLRLGGEDFVATKWAPKTHLSFLAVFLFVVGVEVVLGRKIAGLEWAIPPSLGEKTRVDEVVVVVGNGSSPESVVGTVVEAFALEPSQVPLGEAVAIGPTPLEVQQIAVPAPTVALSGTSKDEQFVAALGVGDPSGAGLPIVALLGILRKVE